MPGRHRCGAVNRVVAELEQLRRELEQCQGCPLSDSSPTVVFGEGNPHSPMVLVGEGPGEREEIEGRPFVGRAGQLLDRLLASAQLRREELWITNVLKRRASKLVGGRVKNRLPRADELAFNKQFLRPPAAVQQVGEDSRLRSQPDEHCGGLKGFLGSVAV